MAVQTASIGWLLRAKCRLKSLFADGNIGSVIMAALDTKRQADLQSLPALRRLFSQVIAVEAHVHVFHAETDTDLARISRNILYHDIKRLVRIDGCCAYF